MMRRPRLTYANVVSTICLFVVLGGGAWAATSLPKKSVGTPQLKANAVTGAKVKDGSLTGADIQAGTLGTVPSATTAGTATNAGHATSADSAGHADSATNAGHATSADSAAQAANATSLDGLGPGAFYPAAAVRQISYEDHWEVDPGFSAIVTVGPLTLDAYCNESEEGGARTLFEVSAVGAAGSTIGYAQQVGNSVRAGVDSLEPSTPTVVQRYVSTVGESLDAFATLVYSDSSRTISIPLSMFIDGIGDTCRVSGSTLVAE